MLQTYIFGFGLAPKAVLGCARHLLASCLSYLLWTGRKIWIQNKVCRTTHLILGIGCLALETATVVVVFRFVFFAVEARNESRGSCADSYNQKEKFEELVHSLVIK